MADRVKKIKYYNNHMEILKKNKNIFIYYTTVAH